MDLDSSTGRAPSYRNLGALVLAGLLLGYVTWNLDFDAFWTALARVNATTYLVAMFCFVVALLLADSLAIRQVYGAHVCPLRYRDLVVIKGASFLPAVLNYHVGQAWLTWFVSRVYRASLARVAGATLLVYATIFAGLFLLNLLAWILAPGAVPWLGPLIGGIGAAAVGYLLVLTWKPTLLRSVPAFGILLEVGIWGHLRALLWRLPHVVVLFLCTWLPFHLFDIPIPLSDALALMPALMLVGALPLTPQGIGTREVLAVELLGAFAPGTEAERAAVITAATFSWGCAMLLFESLISPLMMRAAQGLLTSAQTAVPNGTPAT